MSAIPFRRSALCCFAITALAVVLPAGATAKVSCAEPGVRGGVELRGLPSEPVAERTYAVEAYVPGGNRDVIYGSPALGRVQCYGRRDEHQGATSWVHPRPDADLDASRGRYAYKLRFPHPGTWKLVIQDRRGRYRDLGKLDVVAPPPNPASVSAPAGGGDLSALLVAGGLIVLLAGGSLAIGRRRLRTTSA